MKWLVRFKKDEHAAGRLAAAGVVALLTIVGFAGTGPATASGPGAPGADFVDVADESGLDFVCEHWAKNLGLSPRWFIDVFFCASPVVADFNGDGYSDLYFPNTRYTNEGLNNVRDPQDGLFINNGDGTFTDATRFAGLDDPGYSMGAAAIDHDGDGDLDIYVANFRESPLGFNAINSPTTTFYVNNGDGTFTQDVPEGLVTGPLFGADDSQFGVAVAVADYDLDGDMDIYRGNYAQYKMTSGMPAGLQLTTPDTNNLYRNNGDGTFTDVTLAAQASMAAGRTFAVNFADFNEDGFPDIYVANDENPNELYLNNGDGTFYDFSSGSAADDGRGSMCSEASDFNNDGHLDLYMSHYEAEFNGYYLGNGDATFVENSQLGDLGNSYHILGWACPAVDYDNDGDRDLFVANGHMLPIGGQVPGGDNGYELPNFLFRNTLAETGTHSWEDITANAGSALEQRIVTSGAMPLDVDLDGVQEIVVVNNDDVPVGLFKNQATIDGHWLSLDLRGTTSNTFGIGAKVKVDADGVLQYAERITGNTLASGSVAPLHFGLGAHDGPVTVTVTWPSGLVQEETVQTDRAVRIIEDVGIQEDTLAPKVNVALSGTRGTDGWWTSPRVKVTLDAVDRGFGTPSGVTSLSYRIDDGPIKPYDGYFRVRGEGVHAVTIFAEDAAGNRAWYPLEVKIDSVNPFGFFVEPESGKMYSQGRPVADTLDGSNMIVAPVQTPDAEAQMVDDYGTGMVQYVDDQYGIEGLESPSTEAALDATVGSDAFTLFLHGCEDATSGVDRVVFELDGKVGRVDTRAPFDWMLDLRGKGLGEHVVKATVYDNAGLSHESEYRFLLVPSTQDGVMVTPGGL